MQLTIISMPLVKLLLWKLCDPNFPPGVDGGTMKHLEWRQKLRGSLLFITRIRTNRSKVGPVSALWPGHSLEGAGRSKSPEGVWARQRRGTSIWGERTEKLKRRGIRQKEKKAQSLKTFIDHTQYLLFPLAFILWTKHSEFTKLCVREGNPLLLGLIYAATDLSLNEDYIALWFSWKGLFLKLDCVLSWPSFWIKRLLSFRYLTSFMWIVHQKHVRIRLHKPHVIKNDLKEILWTERQIIPLT